jgi:FMN phosphatase YigB (HAD superfamily)
VVANRVEAVLLDMGGVLIPEVSGYAGAARDATLQDGLRRLGVPEPATLALECGERLRSAYRALEAECVQPDPATVLGELPEDVRRLLLLGFAREAARPPFSYAREVVANLAHRYRLGLVSNTVIPGPHHARSLERAGILPHLGAVAWSANFGRRKPDPAMLHFVLGRLGVAGRHAIFVGDKLRTDVEAARRAGVRSVWLRRQAPLSTDGARPDFVIQDLRELPLLLRRLA